MLLFYLTSVKMLASHHREDDSNHPKDQVAEDAVENGENEIVRLSCSCNIISSSEKLMEKQLILFHFNQKIEQANSLVLTMIWVGAAAGC